MDCRRRKKKERKKKSEIYQSFDISNPWTLLSLCRNCRVDLFLCFKYF